MPLSAKLRSVKWYFLSFVFRNFVSTMFLSHIPLARQLCISVAYERLTGFQEKDNDNSLESILRYNKDKHDDGGHPFIV